MMFSDWFCNHLCLHQSAQTLSNIVEFTFLWGRLFSPSFLDHICIYNVKDFKERLLLEVEQMANETHDPYWHIPKGRLYCHL